MTTFRGPPLSSEPSGPNTLGGFLRDAAARNAGREVIVAHGPAGRTSWTYTDLEREAERVARGLLAQGISPGDRVAVLMGSRPEWVASAFGVALAGGVLVPVNTYLEATELGYVLSHADVSVVLMQDRLASHEYARTVEQLAGSLPALKRVVVLGKAWRFESWDRFLETGEGVSSEDLRAREAGIGPDDDAVIIYTSGTTATPKGVLHPHAPACMQSRRFVRHLGLEGDVRAWSAFPFFWTAGFAMVMGGTLAAGGCLVLQEMFEPGEALSLLESERVTTPHAWPHQLAELEQHPDWSTADLSALQHVESFGSFGRHPTVHVAEDAWCGRSAFGLTETFTIVTSSPATDPPEVRDRAMGAILPGNQIRILSPDGGEPLPAGADGDIAIKGPTLMKQYVKVPPEQTFDADGFFRTGDNGSVDDEGYLHWTGRTSDLIKTGGANVSPVEIEMALLHHPGLKASGAVGVPHPTMGQIVVVVAVAQDGARVDEDDVRAFLRGRIASYKIPRRVVFVGEQDLSLTGNAKIKPEDLRALAGAYLGAETA